MLGIGAATAVIGKANAMVDCPIQSAFDYVGYGLFEYYRLWCPQVVELDVISQSCRRRHNGKRGHARPRHHNRINFQDRRI